MNVLFEAKSSERAKDVEAKINKLLSLYELEGAGTAVATYIEIDKMYMIEPRDKHSLILNVRKKEGIEGGATLEYFSEIGATVRLDGERFYIGLKHIR